MNISELFHIIKNAEQSQIFLVSKVKKEGWATRSHILSAAEETLRNLDALKKYLDRRKESDVNCKQRRREND